MKGMPARKFSQMVATGILFAGLSIGMLAAAEPKYKSITDEELWRQRPANMFKMSENNDPSVCEPLLASLNTSMRITPPPRRSVFDPKPKVSKPKPFPLMRNKFIIDPWKGQEFHWLAKTRPEQRTFYWEAAFIDLDGDGLKDGLFRRRETVSRNDFHRAWFVRSIDPDFAAVDIIDQKDVMDIINNNKLSFEKFDPVHKNRQYIELVKIKGMPYVLIARSFYYDFKEYKKPRNKIQLLKRSAERFQRVCLFDGRIFIIREN